MVSPLCLWVAASKIVRISLETRPRDNLVADENVKKPNKQTKERPKAMTGSRHYFGFNKLIILII